MNTLVGLAVIGMAALSAATLTATVNNAQMGIEHQSKGADIRRQLSSLLADPDVCFRNLGANGSFQGNATPPKTFTELGFEDENGKWNRVIALPSASDPSMSASLIELKNILMVDDDTAISELHVHPSTLLTVTAPLVLPNIQIKFDARTRLQASRPMKGCMASYSYSAADVKGLTIGSSGTYVRGSTGSVSLDIPVNARAINLHGICTIRAGSGATDINLIFLNGGDQILSTFVCSVSGSDNKQTRVTEASRFMRLPAGASKIRIDMILASNGHTRRGAATAQWLE